MTAVTSYETRAASRVALPLAVRLAWRDLRGGIRGFYVFVACIALGVAAIAAVGSLSGSLQRAIEREGQVLLGGDVDVSVIHRQATPDERAWLTPWGQVSTIATLRAMGRTSAGKSTLIDIKAVDGVYPLYGQFRLKDGVALPDALRSGVVIEDTLAAQLGVKAGDDIIIGRATLRIAGLIDSEPDRLSVGPAFGPRVMMNLETLAASGLDEPGSLIRWHYRVKLNDASDTKAFKDALNSKLAAAGFNLRDRTDPSPGITRSIQRLSAFLTLAGLAALLTGGIGVANGVAAFVERKRRVIAIYKSLGANRSLVNVTMLLEILLLAGFGIIIGLAVGGATPALVTTIAGNALPIQLDTGFHWPAALIAALYGLLTSMVFVLWPLGRANEIRAAELLRQTVSPSGGLPPRLFLIGSIAAGSGLALAAVLFSGESWIAAGVCAAMAGFFVLFWGVGRLLMAVARRIPRPRRPELALAVGNLSRPGGLTGIVAVSLGTGLTLLTAIALTGGSLNQELTARLPDKAPSHFFIGIPKADIERFTQLVAQQAPGTQLSQAPMLRGRIVSLKGTPADQVKAPEQAQWVLNGDRGLTFEEKLPADSRLVEGEWWPAGYSGPPLVSFEADLARGLNLKPGDMITVNVLGRNIEARIANLRTVKWESLDINFVMIFSPNTLAAAPYSILATLDWPAPHTADDEARLTRAVSETFPAVTSLRVRDAIETVNKLFARILTAMQAAAGVTLASGIIVLAGALAAAQHRRIYEAVILKTLGATRVQIIAASMAELGIIAVIIGAAATAAGTLAAYVITAFVMNVPFVLSLENLLQATVITTILLIAFGAFGILRVLGAKAAPYLRSE